MNLREALLLVGAAIVGGVVAGTYVKLRQPLVPRRRRSGKGGSHLVAAEESAGPVTASVLKARRETAGQYGLDINPGPPVTSDARFLRPDDPESAAGGSSPELEQYEKLEAIESAALMPLDLSLNIGQSEHSGSGPVRQKQPDEKTDFVIELPGAGPVSRNKALGVYKQNEYLLDKPHQIFGRGYLTKKWSNLESDQEYCQYSDVAVAIQLADCHGPASESEINRFVQMSLKLADLLQRPTKLSVTPEQAVEAALELDRFCEANDVLASVNILSNDPGGFSGRAISQAASSQGMQLGMMNIFHFKNDNPLGCRHLFSLANLYDPGSFDPDNLESTRTAGLTLFMNVPCAYQPAAVFEKMIQAARGICELLDGRLVDQDSRPLTDSGLKMIRTQIDRIATDMQGRGIIPGSEAAMRLF